MRIVIALSVLFVLVSCTRESGEHAPREQKAVPQPSAVTVSIPSTKEDLIRRYAGTDLSPELIAIPKIKSRLQEVLGERYSRFVELVQESKPSVNVSDGKFILDVEYSEEEREKYFVCFTPSTDDMEAATFIAHAMTIYSEFKESYQHYGCVRQWMVYNLHEDEYTILPPPENGEFTFTLVHVPKVAKK